MSRLAISQYYRDLDQIIQYGDHHRSCNLLGWINAWTDFAALWRGYPSIL